MGFERVGKPFSRAIEDAAGAVFNAPISSLAIAPDERFSLFGARCGNASRPRVSV
jgi:hypothetical protein